MLEACRRALAEISPSEWIAVAFALAYLVLAIRQSLWCWACAVVSSAIYLVLFARGGLLMQAWLQVFYIAMAAYGWWAWHGGGAGGEAQSLPVSRWPLRVHGLALLLVVAVSLVNGRVVAGTTPHGIVPYVDALTAWASVFATWLVARKVLENWLYWIVTDLVAAALYWTQGFHATAALFIVYTVLAVRGYQQWRADLQRAATPVEDAVA